MQSTPQQLLDAIAAGLEEGATDAMRELAKAALAQLATHTTAQQPKTDRLTELKADDILRRGFRCSGYVLLHPSGERAIVELSAVRWLNNDQMWQLMHPPA